MKIIHILLSLIQKIFDRLLMYICKGIFCKTGKNVIFHPTNSTFSYKNISIGDNVGI
jgi:hypothetical protein